MRTGYAIWHPVGGFSRIYDNIVTAQLNCASDEKVIELSERPLDCHALATKILEMIRHEHAPYDEIMSPEEEIIADIEKLLKKGNRKMK